MRPLQDFLEKIGIKVIKKSIIKTRLEKKLSNDNTLEMNVAISQKKLSCMIFQKKNDRKKNERKS